MLDLLLTVSLVLFMAGSLFAVGLGLSFLDGSPAMRARPAQMVA